MFLVVGNYRPAGSVRRYLRELNIGLAMKITTILLIVSIVQASASSFAQKVSINQKNISLEEAPRRMDLIHTMTMERKRFFLAACWKIT